MNIHDNIYIQRIRSGDMRAFSGIVANYQAKLLTVILKIVENREEAEDLTQEVFIKVFRSIDKFQGESEFSTWLYRIAYNTALSALRKRKNVISLDDNSLPETDWEADDDDEHTTEERLAALDKALKHLSPDDAFLITLYYMDRQPVEAVATIAGLSVSNVKVRLHRIRKALAAEITKIWQDENR